MSVPELRRILYVEDDPDISTVAVMALEIVGGLEVRACDNGTAAGRVADFAPDLLLIEVMMPGMDGPATLAHLRGTAAFAAVPAMFFTAKVRPDEIARLIDLGAIGVIAKPFDPIGLADEIASKWARHHGA